MFFGIYGLESGFSETEFEQQITKETKVGGGGGNS
jgi:hypothetical protein